MRNESIVHSTKKSLFFFSFFQTPNSKLHFNLNTLKHPCNFSAHKISDTLYTPKIRTLFPRAEETMEMLLGALLCVCGVEERSDERVREKKLIFVAFELRATKIIAKKQLAEKKAVVF